MSRNAVFQGRRSRRGQMVALLLSVAVLPQLVQPALADPGELRILTLNTWGDKFRTWANPTDAFGDFFVAGDYDILTFQELRGNSVYPTSIAAQLEAAGKGSYS